MLSTEDSVVITGIGAVTAYGVGLNALRKGLCDGRSAIASAGPLLPGVEDRAVGLVRDLSEFQRKFPQIRPPLPFPLTRMALLAAKEAIEDSNLPPAARPSTGIFLNRNQGATAVVVKAAEPMFREGPQRMSPLAFSQSVQNAPLGAISIHLGLHGPHILTVGGGAFMLGFEALRSGEADAILCGGIDEVEATTLPAAEALGYLAKPGQEGAIKGEGAVMCLLERAHHARQRGAQVYAELASVAVGSDSALEKIEEADIACWGRPTGAGIAQLLREVLNDAGVHIDDVALMVGTANGQPAIDDAESEAAAILGLSRTLTTTLKKHIGEGAGMAAAASIAWAADSIRRTSLKRNRAPVALVFNMENHALYFGAVLR